MSNLFDTRFPVRRVSGKREWIYPRDLAIVEGLARTRQDPIVDFDFRDPVFNAGARELMVSVLIAAAIVGPSLEDEDDWEKWKDNPPGPDELDEFFSPIRDCFNLSGDGPLFLQESGLSDEVRSVESLLPFAPGNSTKNDFLVRRVENPMLGVGAAFVALFMYQSWSYGGGRSHKTSHRGKCSWSVMPHHQESLWQTLWMATPSKEAWFGRYDPYADPGEDLGGMFPWVGNPRLGLSPKESQQVLPSDVHPVQSLFPMPRRIIYNYESSEGTCLVSGDPLQEGVTSLMWQPYGVDYRGDFDSPFSPCLYTKKGHWIAQGNDLKYSLGLSKQTLTHSVPTEKFRPAFLMQLLRSRINTEMVDSGEFSVRVSAPMLRGKVVAQWTEEILPFVSTEFDAGQMQVSSEQAIALMDKAIEWTSYAVGQSKECRVVSDSKGFKWKKSKPTSNANLSYQIRVSLETRLLDDLHAALAERAKMDIRSNHVDMDSWKASWLNKVRKACLETYREQASSYRNYAPYLFAEKGLYWNLNPSNKSKNSARHILAIQEVVSS